MARLSYEFGMEKMGLLLECFEEFLNSGERSLVFVEQSYKLATDDGPSRVGLSALQSLSITNAETNHSRVLQPHLVDSREVSLLGLVELFLCSGCGRGTDHIDETVGILVDEANAFVARFGRDEHDDPDVKAVGNGFHLVHIVLERQVRNDDAVDFYFLAATEESLVAHMINGIQVAHQYERESDALFPERFQLRKELLEAHSVSQRLSGCVLNDWAVSHRVAKGDAHLDEVYALLFQCADDVGGAFEGRMTSTKIEREQAFALLLK